LAEEDEAEDFYRKSLELLKGHGMRGALARSFGDTDSSLWDKPPFDNQVADRFGGLFRRDGSAKPAARAIQEFSREKRPREADWG
jgi:hypothetical protein